jgi:predicted nucleic acid-binding protein
VRACQLCAHRGAAARWIAATALRLDVRSVSNDLIFETTPGLGLEAVRV